MVILEPMGPLRSPVNPKLQVNCLKKEEVMEQDFSF
jgi:hypothetical protein